MTLDPDFAVNKWVYLLYVKNPQEGVPNISPDIASQGIFNNLKLCAFYK